MSDTGPLLAATVPGTRSARNARAHRRASLLLALPGTFGLLVAPWFVARHGLTVLDLALFVAFYVPIHGLGLSVGYHRHFSHGSFKAGPRTRLVLAVLGAMAGQGPLVYWVGVHRRHHARTDVEGDPHSPNLSGAGWRATLRGLWHGHFGWTLAHAQADVTRHAPEFRTEPALLRVSKHHRAWMLCGLLLPALAGALLGGTWRAAAGGLLWGGLLRLCLSGHSTWALNSWCHRFGTRPFGTGERSTNVAWLALPTMGESWHNNHHAHPRSARHGLERWQLDLNYLLICGLERAGLAHDVQRVRTGSR